MSDEEIEEIEKQIGDETGAESDPDGQDDGMFAQNDPQKGDK